MGITWKPSGWLRNKRIARYDQGKLMDEREDWGGASEEEIAIRKQGYCMAASLNWIQIHKTKASHHASDYAGIQSEATGMDWTWFR